MLQKPNPAAFLVLCAAFTFGCGRPNTPAPDTTPMAEISGTVKVQGKPFRGTGYVVSVLPSSGGSATKLDIDANGNFKGRVPSGSAAVAVVSPDQFMSMHGEANATAPNQQTVTISDGGRIDLDLPNAPAPIPKPVSPSPQSSHSQ